MYPNFKKRKKKKGKMKEEKSNKSEKIEKQTGERQKQREKMEERESRERNSTFSLRSTETGSWVFIRARGKVGPHNEDYAWVPKSRGFVKLLEIGNFSTWIIFSLKAI